MLIDPKREQARMIFTLIGVAAIALGLLWGLYDATFPIWIKVFIGGLVCLLVATFVPLHQLDQEEKKPGVKR